MRTLACLLPLVVGCGADTNAVTVELAPDVISSIDGTLAVHATAFADRVPVPDEAIDLAVVYTDRNGTPHDIAPAQGTTNAAGAFDATLAGLTFDGIGTVTATVTGTTITAQATFAVLDRSPPTVAIMPPASTSVRVGNEVTVSVHVTDEIGVSQVYFEASGNGGNGTRERSTVIASGSTDAMVPFDLQVPDTAAIGATITLYALGADLSGNQAAANPVVISVVQ